MSLQEILAAAVYTARITVSLVLASYTFLIYDFILTFSEEIMLIWRGRWRLPFILYLCTRYVALVDGTMFLLLISLGGFLGLSASRYQVYTYYITWSWCIGSFVAQNILILRTYALCDRNKRLITLLALVHIGCTAGVWIVNSQFLGSVRFIDVPPNTPLAAFSKVLPVIIGPIRSIWRAYLILFLDETVIIGITILYIFRAGGYQYTALIWTIWRDGIAFYMCLQVFSLFNIFSIRFGSSYEYYLCAASFHRVLHSILTARMLLNLRRAALQGRTGEEISAGEPGAIEFQAVPPVLSSHLDFSESMVQTSLAKDIDFVDL